MAAVPATYRRAAETMSERVIVDPTRWKRGEQQQAGDDFGTLQHAVLADLRLRLRYQHAEDPEVRHCTLDPYGLVAKAGVWYLVAAHRGVPRLFRVDRVVATELIDEPVRRRPGTELAEVWEALRRKVEDRPAELVVVARVRRHRLGILTRLYAANLIDTEDGGAAGGTGNDGGTAVNGPDDWIGVRLRYPGLAPSRQLPAFGADLEVIEPEEVREKLARTAAEALTVYGRRPA